jgi:hypothetical protein
MQLMTDREVALWAAQHGIDQRGRKLQFSEPYKSWIVFEMPVSARQLMGLCRDLLLLGTSAQPTADLIWISTWGIWSTDHDDFGEFIVTLLRSQSGEINPLDNKSGHLFNPEERLLSSAILWQTMNFNWDSVLVPATGDHIVKISHDDLVWISCKTEAKHRQLLASLSHWKPQSRKFAGT